MSGKTDRSRGHETLVASLGYHDVTDRPAESGFQRNGAVPYKLGSDQFAKHLDRIAGLTAPALVTDIDLIR
jgi:hypothetical protein